jgi:choline dehydrogenase
VVEAGGFYELDNGIKSQVPGYCRHNATPVLINGNIIDPQPLIDWHVLTKPQQVRSHQLFISAMFMHIY